MKKMISILISLIISLSVGSFALGNEEAKLYINGNEIMESIIMEDGKNYVLFENIIEALNGTFQWNKETNEIDFIYNDVTYTFKHNNRWKAFLEQDYDKNNETGLLYMSIGNNPKNNLVKDIERGIIKTDTSFRFYIYNDELYINIGSGLESIMNTLNCSCTFDDNCLYINLMTFTKDYFLSFLKKDMSMEEVNDKIPYNYKAYSMNKSSQAFVVGYYLKNNSIVELEYVDDGNVSKLNNAKLLTSDHKLVEILI